MGGGCSSGHFCPEGLAVALSPSLSSGEAAALGGGSMSGAVIADKIVAGVLSQVGKTGDDLSSRLTRVLELLELQHQWLASNRMRRETSRQNDCAVGISRCDV